MNHLESVNARLRELILESHRLARAGAWGADAIRVNHELVELEPQAGGAWVRLGAAYYEAGSIGDAIWSYEQGAAHCRQGSLHARIAHRRLDELREQQRVARLAEADLRAFMAVTDPREATDRAIACRERGDITRALRWHNQALDVASAQRSIDDLLYARAALARTLRLARRPGDALAVNDDSIRLVPDHSSNRMSYTSRAATLADLGRLDEAREQIEELLEVDDADPLVLNAAGRIYFELFKRDGAIDLAERAEGCFRRAGEHEVVRSDAIARLRAIERAYRALGQSSRADELDAFLTTLPEAA